MFETVNDVFATDVSIDFKLFLVDDGSYKWAEITKSEFIALRILKRVGDRKISVIEYKPEWSLITVTGDDGFTLGYTSSDITLHVSSDDCEMYCAGALVSHFLREDISNISKESFRCHLGEFDRILEIMRDMETSIFFSAGGYEND